MKDGAGAAYDYVSDPDNWPYLLGALAPEQREQLAQAYERGDGQAVGKILGEQVANLPIGSGGLGTIKKVGNVVDDAGSSSAAVPEGLAYRSDLPNHLFWPDGFTRSGQLSGTHNRRNATAALDDQGATYSLTPTGTTGISELKYSYTNSAGKTISGQKTVYDPAVYSDQAILNMSQVAGQRGYSMYLQDTSQRMFDLNQDGVNFRVYINIDPKTGAPFVGNTHPIK